jgi:VWFA-related protein
VGGVVQRADPPVEVILLIDTVNLDVRSVDFTEQEIERFLRQNGGHLTQPVAIFSFTNQGVKVLLQPSTDGNALAAQLERTGSTLCTIGESAGAYGAIERFQNSVQMLTIIAKNEAKRPGRKLLIWTDPGWPIVNRVNASITSRGRQQFFDWIVQLSTLLREGRITVDSISTGRPGASLLLYKDSLKGGRSAEDVNQTNLDLKVLVTQSGGLVLGPNNDLAGQISMCVQDASNFYRISFDPPHADKPDEYHRLEVRVSQPGLDVRTSSGYYNQP